MAKQGRRLVHGGALNDNGVELVCCDEWGRVCPDDFVVVAVGDDVRLDVAKKEDAGVVLGVGDEEGGAYISAA